MVDPYEAWAQKSKLCFSHIRPSQVFMKRKTNMPSLECILIALYGSFWVTVLIGSRKFVDMFHISRLFCMASYHCLTCLVSINTLCITRFVMTMRNGWKPLSTSLWGTQHVAVFSVSNQAQQPPLPFCLLSCVTLNRHLINLSWREKGGEPSETSAAERMPSKRQPFSSVFKAVWKVTPCI